ncbi:MAG: FAD-dependent monooxygenase, partial [Paracoccaceae bacterium]
MDLTGLRCVIAGGGIGGLAAALALAQVGANVTVCERASDITEVGAGIQISPNGFRALAALGLGDVCRAQSLSADAVSLREDTRGAEVMRLDLTRLPSDQVYRFIHRRDCIDMLAQAAKEAGVTVLTAAEVVRMDVTRPYTVGLVDGRRLPADLIIGADGLHSFVRPQVTGTATPFFTGQVAWRAMVPNTIGHPAEARVHMGPGRHLVSYPLRGGALVNIVGVQERSDWAAEGWSHRDAPQALQGAFADFDASVHHLLSQVQDVGLWGLFRHPVADTWVQGGIALLGDAAHPTLPFLAQGANMALEDAWVLRRCLLERPDLDSALARYQALRRPRTRRIVKAASGNARKYHLPHGATRRVAHLALGLGGRIAPGMML